MQAEGGYPEVLWRYADAVAHGGRVAGGKRAVRESLGKLEGPEPVTVQESYRDALGCSPTG